MLIPSVDLMGGKIVQLVQGERKALEFDDFEQWAERFAAYSIVQIVDLDAAKGRGNNNELVRYFAGKLRTQVGGGIRSIARAREVLGFGAAKVIVGSALFPEGEIDLDFARELCGAIGVEPLLFSVDARGCREDVHGWQESTDITPADAVHQLQSYCSGFLYTNIDTEGMMQGFPIQVLDEIRAATTKKIIAAGGITSMEEVEKLDAMGIDAVVGMAIYTGKLKI